MSSAVLDLHQAYAAKNPPKMAFDINRDVFRQADEVREKYLELLGMPEKTVESVPEIEFVSDADPRFDEIRFKFESEPGLFIPAHMLLPKGVYKSGKKLPVVIGLQGHSTGMHISMGRAKWPGDEETISGGDRDFAVQAVRQGFAAFVLEQRAFGERGGNPETGHPDCRHPAMEALLLGRGRETRVVSMEIQGSGLHICGQMT